MLLKSKLNRYPIGLTWENGMLLVADILKDKEGLICETLKFSVPDLFNAEGYLKDKRQLSDFLKKIKNERGWKGRKTVIAFPSKQVLVRFFRLPNMPLRELRQAVEWEAKQKYNLDKDEYSLDFSILLQSADNNSKEIILAAAVKENVMDLYHTFLAAEIPLKAIDVASFAFVRSLAKGLSDKDSLENKNDLALFLDLNVDFTQIIFYLREQVIFARAINQNYFNSSLTVTKLVNEIQLTVNYLKTIVQDITLKEIVVGGVGTNWGDLFLLQDELGIAVKKGTPGLGYIEEPYPDPLFTTALGLALRGVASDVH